MAAALMLSVVAWIYSLFVAVGSCQQPMRGCAGLDNAILGYLNADERKVDAKRIAQLLAHGAHALQAPDEEAVQEGKAFAEEVCAAWPSFQGGPANLIATPCSHGLRYQVRLLAFACTM